MNKKLYRGIQGNCVSGACLKKMGKGEKKF